MISLSQVLTSETNPRPSMDLYKTWYDQKNLRFVEEIAVPPGEVKDGELVLRDPPATNTQDSEPVEVAAPEQRGRMTQFEINEIQRKNVQETEVGNKKKMIPHKACSLPES